MSLPLPLLDDDPSGTKLDDAERGFGALQTERGPLPLKAMDVAARIDGLLSQVELKQSFANTFDVPLEATYIFPLPPRAAVTRFRMTVADRVVEGQLKERGQARQDYDRAIAEGHRASIAEEDRSDVFTIRVGNLMPGEVATISLTMAGPLPYSDGEVSFRFPLVVAPRYIPGTPLSGASAGDGVEPDTDAVPDASRISPPVLLPGFPNPVRLSLSVDVHAAGLPIRNLRSTLHATVVHEADQVHRVRLNPGERLNRDFILRFTLGSPTVQSALSVHPDPGGESSGGTFALTIVPPHGVEQSTPPRDIVFVLDRSGSMQGWKMVAARRALARMVDTLNERDRFAIIAFDTSLEFPAAQTRGQLQAATDRNRFHAVEFLSKVDARGGTEMAEPLDLASNLLAGSPAGHEHDRILVLVTDGQVGNEDQLLRLLGQRVQGMRLYALGIDRAVNEGFLRRLVALGHGHYDLVESEERLDEVMAAVHRRIAAPALTHLAIEPDGLPLLAETIVPGRLGDVFAGAPVLVLGRYHGTPSGSLRVSAADASGKRWQQELVPTVRDNPAIAAAWARGRIRELEDRYVLAAGNRQEIEQEIVKTSLAFGVLSRFTAFVAIDTHEVVNEGGEVHRVVQPVELPQGWAAPSVTASSFSPLYQMAAGAMPRGGYARERAPRERLRSLGALSEQASANIDLDCRAELSAPMAAASPDRTDQFASYVPPPPASEPMSALPRGFSLGRLWQAVRRLGSKPGGSWLTVRALAAALVQRLLELLDAASSGSAAPGPFRTVERNLAHLIKMGRRLSAPAPQEQAMEALHGALRLWIGLKNRSDADTLALRQQAEQTQQVVGTTIQPLDRSDQFWK